ncbi:hypothetical protein pb186bvf_000478 [Paramecium bursaria]
MKSIGVFIFLNICNIVCCFALSIIAPFFPTYAKDKGLDLDLIGYIFSLYPLGMLLGSLILGKIITDANRPKIMNVGVVLEGIALILFAMMYYTDDHALILSLAVIARLIGGFATSMFLTPFYAYIQQLFPQEVEKMIAYCEVCTALGYMGGPIFGSLLYKLGGFTLPFYFFAGLSLFLGACLPIYYKSLQGFTESFLVFKSQAPPEPDEPDISYLKVIMKYPVMATLVSVVMIYSIFTFYHPIQADYFQWQYGVDADSVGYYMSMVNITFVSFSLLVAQIKTMKPFFVYFGLIFSGYLQLYAGPDYDFTQQKPDIWITTLAWVATGIFTPAPYVLGIPQLNNILNDYYPDSPKKANNIASALYNACLAMGGLLGPVIGGYLGQFYGFQRSTSLLGLSVLAAAAFYAPYLFIFKEGKVHEKHEKSIKKNK